MKTKVQTEWNFKLFYKNPKDPQIEKDVLSIEKGYKDFAKLYAEATDYTESAELLKKALTDYERMLDTSGTWKPVLYFWYRKDVNGSDTYADAQITKYSNRLTQASNKILFFGLKLGKINKSKQEEYLSDQSLLKYHYFLKTTFDAARHDLSESEEKIMNLKQQPAHEMWLAGFDKFLYKQIVDWKGKKYPLSTAVNMVGQLGMKDRRKLSDTIGQKLKSISDFAEAELNAVFTNKKINDELRELKHPFTATLITDQMDEEVVLNLVNTVTKHYKIGHRFFKLKARLLKQKQLEWADERVAVGKVKRSYSFEKMCDITKSAFEKVNPYYREIFEKYLKEGRIDVYVKEGKTGGGYCSSTPHTPTMILLNFASDMGWLRTVAHEMGHAIHSEFDKVQPILYQGCSYATAEVASTLFENFVFEEVFKTLPKQEQIYALADRINEAVVSIFCQIACFNFEWETHTTLRQDGFVSKEKMSELMQKHLQAYTGPAITVKEIDGYRFVRWNHIRRFFYVYTYAFGHLVSTYLFKEYVKNPSFLSKIEQYLKAGTSNSPKEIFKSIGIDISKPEFFEAGLKSIEDDIKRLEKLVK